ncbi:RAMP superfamily CRISPR-associated protein [Thermoleptolyngbya sp.]
MKFQLTITMQSDWHIGAGAGRRGDIDRLIQRDTDGLPYLPAKTLTGIWRDACELIADGLDGARRGSEGQSPSWNQWVNFLFGDQPAIAPSPIATAPQPAALSIRPAHLPLPIKTLLQHRAKHHKAAHQALQSAFTFIKPGISIDAKTGCALEDFLRFEEMARIGTVLTADCELRAALNQDQQQAACTLLAAGAKVVERLGGKRRRGAGRCEFRIDWPGKVGLQQPAWDILAQDAPELPKALSDTSGQVGEQTNSLDILSEQSEWQRMAIALEALTPLVIPARTIGNVVETLDYIPGTYLLRLVLQQVQSLGVDLADAVARGDLLVTHATIAIADQPGQPIPAGLFYEKSGGGLAKGGRVYNRFCESGSDTQVKGYRKGYIEFTKSLETLPEYQTVDTLVGTHNTIEDPSQRPTSEVGGVYSYEAIAPKTRFRAELRMRQSIYDALCQKQADWYKKLEGNHRIGQSKKDDYGAVNLIIEIIQQEREKDTANQPTEQPEKLCVWLLSDVLLRNDFLRSTASLEDFQTALQQALNADGDGLIKLKLATPGEGLISAMLRSHRVESWQTRWNLPRPSLVGIAAGSCMVFEVESGTLDPQRLKDLELSGMGERTAEGYGQLCFNHPLLNEKLSEKKSSCKTEKALESEQSELNPPPLLSASHRDSDVFKYARLIETAAWREAIRKAALFLAGESDRRQEILGIRIQHNERGEPVSQPSMSQLGGLRSVVSQLKSTGGNTPGTQPNPVTSWIGNIREKKSSKWDGTDSGLDKIGRLIEEREQVWQYINAALHPTDPNQSSLNYPLLQELTLTKTGEADLKQELWAEAVQILIYACIRAHKRELEKKEREHEQEQEQEQAAVAGEAKHGA